MPKATGSRYRGTSQVLDFMSGGTYQRDILSSTNQTWTADTEIAVTGVPANIDSGGTNDSMWSWIRCNLYFWNAASQPCLFEWVLLRQVRNSAVPNLNDSDWVELQHKDGKILAHGFYAGGDPSIVNTRPVKFEVYNVKLRADEWLTLIVRPLVGSTQVEYRGVLEWRQVGV